MISLMVEDDRLILKVFNTGEGIKKEDKENIFDRYQLLDNNAKPNVLRTGLGLHICNKLVRVLDGEITIKSEVGHFAEFTVSLPKRKSENIKVGNEIVVKSEDYDVSPSVSDSSADKPTVLVVDDHKDIVWLISETLSKDFYVEKAYSAKEAFQKLNHHTPSLLITDIMMPGMNGIEFIEELRKNKFLRNIPIIIVSAKISEDQQAEGIKSGADAYLTKPFSNSILLSMVHRLISKHKELKEYFYSPESAFVCAEGQLIHQEDQEFMDMVSEIIKENIENDELGPEMISELLHINSRALYRRFKRISDTTPIEFIKNYRLSYAAQLLLTTTYSIQEIIYKIGISNKSYFYREFGKKYGMTPKEYRVNT